MTKLFDLELSREVAAKIEVMPQSCYHKAYLALCQLVQGEYVEGYCLAKWLIFEHAWVEQGDKIIDVTYLNDLPRVYFAGLRFDGVKAVQEATGNNLELPIFYRYGWGGSESPDMVAAYQAAWLSLGNDPYWKV